MRRIVTVGAAIGAAALLLVPANAAFAGWAGDGMVVSSGHDYVFAGAKAACGQNGASAGTRGWLLSARIGDRSARPADMTYIQGVGQPRPVFDVPQGGNPASLGATGPLAQLSFGSATISDQHAGRTYLDWSGGQSPIKPEVIDAQDVTGVTNGPVAFSNTQLGLTNVDGTAAMAGYVTLTDGLLQQRVADRLAANGSLTFADLVGDRSSTSILAGPGGPFVGHFWSFFTISPEQYRATDAMNLYEVIESGTAVTMSAGSYRAVVTQDASVPFRIWSQTEYAPTYETAGITAGAPVAPPTITAPPITMDKGAGDAGAFAPVVTDSYVGPDAQGSCAPAITTALTRITVTINGTAYPTSDTTAILAAVNALEPGTYTADYHYDGVDAPWGDPALSTASVSVPLVVTGDVTPTQTPTPTDTETPTSTPTPTDSSTSTPTPTDGSTSTPTPTDGSTGTPTPTASGLATTGGASGLLAGLVGAAVLAFGAVAAASIRLRRARER